MPKLEEYDGKYNECVSQFRQNNQARDICISRILGEDFSLCVEIVRAKKVDLLFDKFLANDE